MDFKQLSIRHAPHPAGSRKTTLGSGRILYQGHTEEDEVQGVKSVAVFGMFQTVKHVRKTSLEL